MHPSPSPVVLTELSCREPGQGLDVGSHLRAAFDAMPFGLLTFNRKLDVLFTNARLAATLDIQPVVVQRAASLLHLLEGSAALGSTAVQSIHEACLGVINASGEHRSTLTTTAGTTTAGAASRYFALHVSRLDDGQWMASFEEITERLVAEATAIELALRDPLTGLPNRELFNRRAAAALAGVPSPDRQDGAGQDGARQDGAGQDEAGQEGAGKDGIDHAVLLVDLDRFKTVNDTLGHLVGDGLLRLVSKRLRSVLRQGDMVARLGGDEFALMVSPSPGMAGLTLLATRIVDVVGRPYLVDGHLVNIGASVGVAISPQDGREHDQLLRSADLALYAAKQAGRNTFSFFEPALDARALARRSLEIDLRKALALREFELHYQPQIDLDQNAIVGFEALLRWRHPERGLVSPADFIPLAEEIGLIVPLGEWVLREACREAAQWPGEVSVAVNVSPHQFGDTGRLIAVVAQALAAANLPGRRLEVEITESVLLRNDQAVLTALHELRAMEVRVAMDDFGTGYSSLSQLHSFPFDKIKIDRSFVKGNGDIAGQNAIIRAITALGVSLGMSTIAEGVETSDQLARIRTEGCTSVQGYLFSQPVPVDKVACLIADFADRYSVPATKAA